MKETKSIIVSVSEHFFHFLRTMTKAITALGVVGLFVFLIMYLTSGGSTFAVEESRLATQIDIILGTMSNKLGSTQRENLVNALIEKYDPSTDSLQLVVNPNADSMTLNDILSHFNLEGRKYVPKKKDEDFEENDENYEKKDSW